MEPGEQRATSCQLAGTAADLLGTVPRWEEQATKAMEGPGLDAALSPTASLWASLLWASVSPADGELNGPELMSLQVLRLMGSS